MSYNTFFGVSAISVTNDFNTFYKYYPCYARCSAVKVTSRIMTSQADPDGPYVVPDCQQTSFPYITPIAVFGPMSDTANFLLLL